MRTKLIVTTLAAAAAIWAADIGISKTDTASSLLPSLTTGSSKALAQAGPGSVRGTARRTSRRTTRRVARRTSVAGCAPYRAYYNCGGVYYAPVQENGTTVYIVVNP